MSSVIYTNLIRTRLPETSVSGGALFFLNKMREDRHLLFWAVPSCRRIDGRPAGCRSAGVECPSVGGAGGGGAAGRLAAAG